MTVGWRNGVMRLRPLTVIALLTLLTLAAVTTEAWARAGSGGSRGSRSYSPPAQPSSPVSPRTPMSPARPAPAPMSSPRPSMFGGLMGAIGGFMLGGLLGSLLFGGLGAGAGIGLLDILLVVGGVFLLFKLMQARRQQQPQPAYAGAGGWSGGDRPEPMQSTAVVEPSAADVDLDRGLAHIRQMDASFDAAALASDAAETFRTVQNAVAARDLAPLAGRIAPELLEGLQRQVDELRQQGQINRLERIQIERTEVTEAWQERGSDFVTVAIVGTLLDYVVDAAGRVVAGSSTVPDRFEEHWTFTRPVGTRPWQLTAIQTG
jgi:predicted lipid-binding transport protein (Tim44 family)